MMRTFGLLKDAQIGRTKRRKRRRRRAIPLQSAWAAAGSVHDDVGGGGDGEGVRAPVACDVS